MCGMHTIPYKVMNVKPIPVRLKFARFLFKDKSETLSSNMSAKGIP